MGRVKMISSRYLRIKVKIEAGIAVVRIAGLEGCSERTVRQIRDGTMPDPASVARSNEPPPWSAELDWDEIYKDVVEGDHCLSDIWEEKKPGVSCSQFRRYFNQRYPLLKKKISTPRFFEPGERVEVDFSGKKVAWIDVETGEISELEIFIGSLGHSQKVFACGVSSQKSEDFIDCHNKMFSFYGGVPRILVPDNLKSGVTKVDMYDPKINEAYEDMATHYDCVVVPARSYKPKDKSLAEGLVKLTMRSLRFLYRRHTFTSPEEINEALLLVCKRINEREHTRFKVSREERFQENEKGALKPLPENTYEFATFKEAMVHPDSHIQVENNYYSVPHEYRGERVRVRLTPSELSVFKDLKRVAKHKRAPKKKGRRSTELSHMPERSKAYLETTPQNILNQARFINKSLAECLSELFKEKGTLENLRRAQGIVRAAYAELRVRGREGASQNIEGAVKSMRGFNRVNTGYFRELLKKMQAEGHRENGFRPEIARNPNPNLRHTKLVAITPNEGEVANGISTSKESTAGAQTTWDV